MVAPVPAQIPKLPPDLPPIRPWLSAPFPTFRPSDVRTFRRSFVAPLFSYSYELLFPQALCFDNHPHCPGVCGVCLRLGSHESPITMHKSRLFKLLRTLCRLQETNPPCRSPRAHSAKSRKAPGVGNQFALRKQFRKLVRILGKHRLKDGGCRILAFSRVREGDL
jgi:hypothetical protein